MSKDMKEIRRVRGASKDSVVVKDYPLDVFPNWNVLSTANYYVAAPVDRLGDWAFHLRSHLTALILSGNPAITFLQSRHTPQLTQLAYFFSAFGQEDFFFCFVVANLWLFDARLGRLLAALLSFGFFVSSSLKLWLFDARLGRLLAALLSFGFFVSSSLKVGLCLPRPPAPPALRLSEENKDWAWPSNHALLGTCYPWFIWMYASQNYHLSLSYSLLLLFAVFTFAGNVGVSWSRVYLGVHSPCDVLAGWTIGVLLLFVFGGFADKMYEVYEVMSGHEALVLISCAFLLLYVHPRAWPETQSFGEVVSVLSGAVAIWTSRALGWGGDKAPLPLWQTEHLSAFISYYPLRFITGVLSVVAVRAVVKPLARRVTEMVYEWMGFEFYSYTDMCKSLGDQWQPTKRYTSRLRFKPIAGQKVVSLETVPYDVDVVVKIVVYATVGMMVGEGAPAIFRYLEI